MKSKLWVLTHFCNSNHQDLTPMSTRLKHATCVRRFKLIQVLPRKLWLASFLSSLWTCNKWGLFSPLWCHLGLGTYRSGHPSLGSTTGHLSVNWGWIWNLRAGGVCVSLRIRVIAAYAPSLNYPITFLTNGSVPPSNVGSTEPWPRDHLWLVGHWANSLRWPKMAGLGRTHQIQKQRPH